MSFTFTISLKLTATDLEPVQSSFVDDAENDPPTMEWDVLRSGTLRWDFHSSATPPAAGSGDIATGTFTVVGGPQNFSLDLESYPDETGYLHFRVINGDGESNIFTSQVITTPPVFAPANLFEVGDKGFVIDPSLANRLYQDTGKTTLADTDGESVALIVDDSGVTADLTQATASYRPVYKTNGSLHWILTDGNDFFTLPAGVLDNSKNWTLVFAMDTSDNTDRHFFGTDDLAYYFHHNASGYLRLQVPGTTPTNTETTSTSTAELYTITFTRSTGTWTLRVNGVQKVSQAGTVADIPSKTWKLFAIGSDGYTLGGTGKFYLVVAIDRALGVSELENLEAFAAAKAGITL